MIKELNTHEILSNLQTESRNTQSKDIDTLSALDICKIINVEDSQIAGFVRHCLDDIATVIDLVAEKVRLNGRVVYMGAGTSGRLGVLDASEIPPTFSAPYSQFIGIMAGGDTAIRKAVEGAEDSTILPVNDLKILDPPLSTLDTVIGIASSGRTPYVLGGLQYAQEAGALAVGLCCVKPSLMRDKCSYVIECVVGPEVVTGSTRLKAGTATKLILNMISTGVMIRIGKTYGNLMVDVKPSNRKLVDRARRIFRTVLPTTTLSDFQIDELILSCDGNVKLAIVVERHKCEIHVAKTLLENAGGLLRNALEHSNGEQTRLESATEPEQFVLCIDAGGTKCKAIIADKNGILSQGQSGPCNFVTLGHDVALSVLAKAVSEALAALPKELGISSSLPIETSLFSAAWIGGAGLDRSADLTSIRGRIASLLKLSTPTKLMVTNDAALLSSAIANSQEPTPSGIRIHGGIVLVTGTGTIAYNYALPDDGESSSLPRPLNRSSGWGYLLGDEGSAFAIGRDAVRAALDQSDRGLPPTPLHLAITRYFGCQSAEELISAVYLNVPPILKEGQDSASVDTDPKLRIAGVCRLVFNFAFPTSPMISPNNEALEIVTKAAGSAANTVISLLVRSGWTIRSTSASVLVFGGALSQVEGYRMMILEALRIRGYSFARSENVANAAEAGVQVLIRDYLT